MNGGHAGHGHGHDHGHDHSHGHAHDHDHAHDHGSHDAHGLGFLRKYIFSTDHKVIGIQFLFTSLLMMGLGGGLAMALRWVIAWPEKPIPFLGRWLFPHAGGIVSPEFFTMLTTMHATVMIFFVVIPILTGAFGNFLIPLMIGARDMAFPVLNMISYWFMVPAIGTMLASFHVVGGAAAAGWTSYPPLAAHEAAAPGSGLGQTLWLVSLLFVGLSSLAGSINYVTTIVMLRAPGMTMFRLPMTVWALFITAILQAFALPVLTAGLILGVLDRTLGFVFFTPALPDYTIGNHAIAATGGQPLLWQHVFWFYSHPAVYIMILPAMGFVSDIIACFSRKPLFGYKPMVCAIATIAGLGFIVWGHHMFQSGMNPAVGMAMMVSTMFIALPSAVKVFNWLGTLWGANIRFTTAMLNALSFVSMFVIGGLSGLFMASTPVDIYIHDTYFIVAHIHYVLFGGSLFGAFAAVYFWFPKMFGRHMDETWGKIHFVLSFLAFNMTFFLMHIVGIGGMPRRYMSFEIHEYLGPFHGLNKVMTMSAWALGLSQIPFLVNFAVSLFAGRRATQNPWDANTLEWAAAPSPPPHGNFGPELPTVYRPPYEYSVPGAAEDFIPQNSAAGT